MKKFCYKCTGSCLLLLLGVLAFWFTWGLEKLSVIGGCLILGFTLSGSYLLWKDASVSRKGENDG